MKRKDVEARLEGSALELKGKSGGYELHNVYAEPDKSFCSKHKTLDSANDRIDTVLGTGYGR